MLDVHRLYPEILGKIEIYADGGVRRASHILTLLSLGVTAVGMGRPFIFANVYGQSGVTQLINILIQELKTEMQNMGQADVTQFRGNSSFVSLESNMYFLAQSANTRLTGQYQESRARLLRRSPWH